MHILIIPSSLFVTETEPHNSIFQLHQAKALKSSGNTVGVLSIGYITLRNLFNKYKYKQIEKRDGININRKYDFLFFPHRYIPFFILKFMYEQKGIKYYKKYIEKHGVPDVIHAHNFFYAGIIAQAIKKRYGIKYIITEHSSAFHKMKISPMIKKEISSCAFDSTKVTAVSHAFADDLKKRIEIDISILPNLVDDDFFVSEPNLIKNSNNFVFLNIASMDNNKNQELLIKAFAKKFKNTSCELKIVGSGELKDKLHLLVKEMNIESQVKFLGNLLPHDIKKELLNADCFVLSSNYETFGVVLIEALACGTPVVATKCGGPQDIVNEQNGILVDVGNLDNMSQSMDYIYKEIDKFNSNLIIEDVKFRFGTRAFLNKVMKFYNGN